MHYLRIVPAQQEHITHVCTHLRHLDRLEIAALHNCTIEHAGDEALRQCTTAPQQVYAGINKEGEAVTIFGREYVANIGIGLWLLATDLLQARALLHHTRHVVQQLAQEHTIFCLVWSGQRQSLRFLRHLGFRCRYTTVIHSQTFQCLLYTKRG